MITYFVGADAVEEIEEAAYGFADGDLIGNNDASVLVTVLEPFTVKPYVITRIERKECTTFGRGKDELFFVTQAPTS